MKMRSVVIFGCLAACALLAATTARAERVWVSDQFEIMLRTGPSTGHAIERMLGSGIQLEVLETDAESGYSRVRTTGGTEGWVLSRYLMGEPPAREQLRRLSSQLSNASTRGTSMASQLNAIESEQKNALRRINELESVNTQLTSELAEIKRVAANVLSINTQNKSLRQQLTDAGIRIDLLQDENAALVTQSNRFWFLIGALVLLGGIFLGLILPKIKIHRRSGYDRF